jgi:hypothetical protein
MWNGNDSRTLCDKGTLIGQTGIRNNGETIPYVDGVMYTIQDLLLPPKKL